ncbi:hypothetical protein B0H11DRAFT_1956410 [Mycena galericulata]|nr:hypothetical protein B0H11DRAFT_1956410 [Mycena galericulata]
MADKKAMSRALGAAFLSHQVEQLEKSAASGNWRSRTPNSAHAQSSPKRGGNNANYVAKSAQGPRKKTPGVLTVPRDREIVTPAANVGRLSTEDRDKEKDADTIVVDASVLVHALHQVKKWCRDGRTEVVIVPLEALNTLDLLKKGTSALAQRARAASRILEAQVGTNPRIRVQQDDAFVPWDAIPFADNGAELSPPSDSNVPSSTTTSTTDAPDASPEWLRRTVCCARWELETALSASASAPDATHKALDTAATAPRTVRLAVLAPPSVRAPGAGSGTPPSPTLSTADGGPLTKHEPRAAGALVRLWAARAGVAVLPVPASSPNPNPNAHSGAATGANANLTANSGGVPVGTGRPRAGTGPQTKRGASGGGGGYNGYGGGGGFTGGGTGSWKGGSLVERPAAALALEGPGSPRVVRVLARGERLDAVAVPGAGAGA